MKKRERGVLLLGGGLTGIANGLFGGGGGMIAVPLLQRAAGYSVRSAHATAIAVIAPASLLSGAVYLFCGLVPFDVLLPVMPGVLFGGFLGAKLLTKISSAAVTFAFAAFMLAAGVRMLLP